MSDFPSLADFKAQQEKLRGRIIETPTTLWDSPLKRELLGDTRKVYLKREYLQHTGSFKARGALSVVDSLPEEALKNGVVAASGGNHGIAVSYAAKAKGVSAKIVVHEGINPYRYNRMIEYGAEVIKIPELSMVFEKMHEIAEEEKRTPIHAFEHPMITLGAGTIGIELMEQVGEPIDAVLIPIGGGGLCSGVSCAVKRVNPECEVFGVEPTGANSMYQSFKKGGTLRLNPPAKSIADSLSAPMSEAYSYSVCRAFVDEIVLIEDKEMADAMRLWKREEELELEPACAATTAAFLGSLKERLKDRSVALVLCGSNIDSETFRKLTT